MTSRRSSRRSAPPSFPSPCSSRTTGKRRSAFGLGRSGGARSAGPGVGPSALGVNRTTPSDLHLPLREQGHEEDIGLEGTPDSLPLRKRSLRSLEEVDALPACKAADGVVVRLVAHLLQFREG